MTYKDKIKAAELRQRIVKHDRAFQDAEIFLHEVDDKIELLQRQIAGLEANVKPMIAESKRAWELKGKNKRALDKMLGKLNMNDKLVRYRKQIRALEREIAQG